MKDKLRGYYQRTYKREDILAFNERYDKFYQRQLKHID